MKVIIISNVIVAFAAKKQLDLEALRREGIFICPEQSLSGFQFSVTETKITFREKGAAAIREVELCAGEKCVAFVHGSLINVSAKDQYVANYSKAPLFLYTIRHVKTSKYYSIIRDFIENDIMSELKEAIQDMMWVPWRFEYYVEIALRLLCPNNAENNPVVKKIMFGEQPAPADQKLKEISNSFDTYESKCGTLDEGERTKLSAVRMKILEQTFDQPGLLASESYRRSYREIVELLYELARSEVVKVCKTRIGAGD